MGSRVSHFTHRCNADGTYDPICTRCFRTIGHAIAEQALFPVVSAHPCSTGDLGRIMKIHAPRETRGAVLPQVGQRVYRSPQSNIPCSGSMRNFDESRL
jgi:hypothetical protein